MILRAEGLQKRYERGGRTFFAVQDADLSIEAGDFISIIGRSGSGKSTLLNLLAGLLTPDAGTVEWNGKKINILSDEERSGLRNSTIGYIPQGVSTLSGLTVWDNVRLPFFLAKRKGDPTERALELLGQVGLSELAGSYPRDLSGGEQRRVSIARALINQPDLIIADEPTGDLDTQNTREIMELFRGISEAGTAVLLVTHDLETVKYGKTTLRMEDGRLSET
ncbi:MAG: ABC transporter ATP-binding protein [Oscillospiraceae bacterium]|nr:ABC transporter ATP-binding protein [Oscillospiraceae bacterium]